ncbi:pyrBI operon leader peptide [Escherichia coli]
MITHSQPPQSRGLFFCPSVRR